MMKKLITLYIIALSIVNYSYSQELDFLNPDSILIGNKERPKVLLVGSWHFNYPGLDAHQIEENDKINIYSKKRQKELNELLEYMAQFKLTKIVVESGSNTGYLLNNFKAYKDGKEELYANERSQIGMRLVNEFKLDTIYGVDDWPLLIQLHNERDTLLPETYTDKILARHYFGGDDEISKRYSNFYEYRDRAFINHTLLENFTYLNSKKVIDRGFGPYISGGQFESENDEGPDALSMFWINRNLRIYKNIKDIGIKTDDRVLVLFGSGHISILHWLFQCSPEFELIEFNELNNE